MRELEDNRENATLELGSLINKIVFAANDGRKDDFIKHMTIFSCWKDIVGNRFSCFSKPYSIKYSKLYVSAKSPVIVQELSLLKKKLIEKVNMYSKPLGIEIKDIIFDYKKFEVEKKEELIGDEAEYFSENELTDIKIDSSFEENITKNIDKLSFLTEKQKNNLKKQIINTQKAKIKRQN